MLFNSLEFLMFLPIVTLIYFLIPHKYRWALLLFSSYYFYMCWKPQYIILIMLSTAVVYFAGIKIEDSEEQKQKKKYLIISLVINLVILFLFKYFNFFNHSLERIFTTFNLRYNVPNFSLMLPVGISFYTFQALSYAIDVYKGQIKAERHFGIFALYVSFFPQLVAGPIERSDRLLPQFYKVHKFDYDRMTDGLKIIAWGFFKKVVIADRVATLVNTVYNNPYNYSGYPLILATVFFAFQIYCDFSGYSDIAVGCAKIMGFNLMNNFESPYFAKSIGEFWRTWHISLSTWFRDYVYIPMGGNRTSSAKWYRNLLATFLLSGLWHGANWTFVVWGLIHGMYQVISKLTENVREKFISLTHLDKLPILHKEIQVLITFCLVCFAWIFFRANSMREAIYIVTNLFKGLNVSDMKVKILNLGLNKSELIISLVSIFILAIVDFRGKRENILRNLSRKPVIIRWATYYLLIVSILIFGVYGYKEFIYFQF